MEDCLVLGGGVIGLSLAYELAAHGATVRILERAEAGREASWAGAGILPPGNIAAPRTADETLILLCHELHPRWAAQLREETGIDNGYRLTGGVYVAQSAGEVAALRHQARTWRDQGISLQEVEPAELAKIEPMLTAAAKRGDFDAAFFAPDEAQVRNPRHVRALVAACLARGVCIEQGVTVEDFELRGDRIAAVKTTAGRATAGSFCVTAGSWTQLLLARLGMTVPVTPIRGQIALLNTGTRLMTRVVNVGRSYLVPRDDGRVLVGSTEEDVGFVKRTTAEAIGELLRFATALAPGLSNAALEMSWAGLRPASPDGRPFLGRVPGLDNLWIAAGHFRSGLQLSPGTAVVMRQSILGEPVELDLSAFGIDRDQPAKALHGR